MDESDRVGLTRLIQRFGGTVDDNGTVTMTIEQLHRMHIMIASVVRTIENFLVDDANKRSDK